MNEREKIFRLRLTQAEFDALIKKAVEQGLTPSEYLRQCIRQP